MMQKQNKMAIWSVHKLFFAMGMPAVFSMLIQAMYNIVDSIYISEYSQDAMFAIGLASPMQMIGLSIALGGAIGVGSLISRRLGQNNHYLANQTATTGFIITILHIILVMLMGLFLARPFLALFTSRNDIIELGNQYLFIVTFFCFGQFFSILFERILQAQGNMIFPMFAQLLGAITNIILDPLFIFGSGFIPELGMIGAAIATVLGQLASCIFIVSIALFKKHEVSLDFKHFKLEKDCLKGIYAVGLPASIMNMIGSFTTTFMNGILVKFSEDAVTSLTIYFRLQSFVFMPLFGFNQGTLPILSYCYGAKNKKRYLATVKLFMAVGLFLMFIGLLIFKYKTDFLLSFFTMNDNLYLVASKALNTICYCFIPAAIGIPISTIFQSFGEGTMSMVQSILRQIGILIPSAYLLSFLGLDYVWYAYVIAEGITLLIYLPLVYRSYRNHF